MIGSAIRGIQSMMRPRARSEAEHSALSPALPEPSPHPTGASTLHYSVDRFSFSNGIVTVRGWAFATLSRPSKIRLTLGAFAKDVEFIGQDSDDVVSVHGAQAGKSRFLISVPWTETTEPPQLAFILEDGSSVLIEDAVADLLPPGPSEAPAPTGASTLHYSIDRFSFSNGIVTIKGWVFSTLSRLSKIRLTQGEFVRDVEFVGQGSDDVVSVHGAQAENSRFLISVPWTETAEPPQLAFLLEDGSSVLVKNAAVAVLSSDPYHRLTKQFFDLSESMAEPRILEIGSRARSGNSRRDRLPEGCVYTGFDIIPGDNVDLVGDAHMLSSYVEPNSFDAVFSISVFEHLIMPWKACLEINRILKPGGLLFISSHHTFPLHEVPWDFFRFSDKAWLSLLNPSTGFEIIETALGEPASVVPHTTHLVTAGMEEAQAYLGSAVLARKVADTTLEWPVDPKDLVQGLYPH